MVKHDSELFKTALVLSVTAGVGFGLWVRDSGAGLFVTVSYFVAIGVLIDLVEAIKRIADGGPR